MYSSCVTGALPPVGFPIRKSPGQSLFSGSPKLIAAYRVLHRLSLPRHPPYALSSLTIKKLFIVNAAMSYTATDNLRAGWLNPFCTTLSKRLTPTNSLYAIVKELY